MCVLSVHLFPILVIASLRHCVTACTSLPIPLFTLPPPLRSQGSSSGACMALSRDWDRTIADKVDWAREQSLYSPCIVFLLSLYSPCTVLTYSLYSPYIVLTQSLHSDYIRNNPYVVLIQSLYIPNKKSLCSPYNYLPSPIIIFTYIYIWQRACTQSKFHVLTIQTNYAHQSYYAS